MRPPCRTCGIPSPRRPGRPLCAVTWPVSLLECRGGAARCRARGRAPSDSGAMRSAVPSPYEGPLRRRGPGGKSARDHGARRNAAADPCRAPHASRRTAVGRSRPVMTENHGSVTSALVAIRRESRHDSGFDTTAALVLFGARTRITPANKMRCGPMQDSTIQNRAHAGSTRTGHVPWPGTRPLGRAAWAPASAGMTTGI